jgi:hypothetical protein
MLAQKGLLSEAMALDAIPRKVDTDEGDEAEEEGVEVDGNYFRVAFFFYSDCF